MILIKEFNKSQWTSVVISLNEVDLLTITIEYVTGTIINAYLINFQVRIKHCLSNLFRNDHQWILVNMCICILYFGGYRFLHCGMDFGHSPKFLIHKKIENVLSGTSGNLTTWDAFSLFVHHESFLMFITMTNTRFGK